MSFSCYSRKTVYSPLRLLSRPEIIQCHLCKQNDHTERGETKTLSDHWLKIFFVSDFHWARALSCSDRVVSFEADKSELEFLKTWSYLKIIDLRPDRGMGSLPRIIHLGRGGRVGTTKRGLHNIRILCNSHKLLKLKSSCCSSKVAPNSRKNSRK